MINCCGYCGRSNIDIMGAVIVTLLLSLAVFALIFSIIFGYGYKQGQIDAINGNIKYQLKKSEKQEWIPIKGK
ncbi:MAG: hypothetical protein M0P71_01795 [Melioribacteraceae bacterium]|nr:hypothetical protein [Melioribacteraceae bacterium]